MKLVQVVPNTAELAAWDVSLEVANVTTRYLMVLDPDPLLVVGEMQPTLLSEQVYLWAKLLAPFTFLQLREGKALAKAYFASIPYTPIAEALRGDAIGLKFLTSLGFRIVAEVPDRLILKKEVA